MLSGLLALLVALAVIAPFALDLNNYKGYVTTLIEEQTGRALTIDGNVDLSVLPIPTIKASGVRFANLEGAAAPDMLRIATVEASIALAPLLRGAVMIDSLTFVDPVIELETLSDGRANWQITPPGGGDDGTGGGSDPAVRIESLIVENATLIYRDGAKAAVERIEGLYLDASVDSITGPYSATGRLTAQSGESSPLALAFTMDVGRLDSRPLPLRATITLADADASITFTGSATSASADAELVGKLKLEAASLARILAALGDGEPDPMLDQPVTGSATLTASSAAAGVNDILFSFGSMQGSGAISATLAPGPQIDVAVNLNRVDLDDLLAKGTSGKAAPASSAPFALPQGIYATLDLRINALVFRQAVVRQVQFVAALDQGVLTVQQGSALLPGSSDVTVFGVLDGQDGKPHFTGQVEASADNLRAVLDWLDIPLPDVPAERLRKLSLSGKVEVTPNLAKISAIDLRVDLSRLSGGVNIGIGARPAFNAIVSIDKINLDGYLPDGPADTDATGDATGDGDEEDDNPLALLDAFDAEIKAKIGSLTYNAATLSGIALDAGLRRGVLTVRGLRVGDVAGAALAVAGSVDSAKPGFDITYDLDANDGARLFQLADIAPPSPNIGPLTIKGRIKGDLAAVTLDSGIILSDAEARLKGSVTDLTGLPLIDADVSLKTGSLGGLAARFGATLSANADTPFTLQGKIKGDVEEAAVALTVATLGADVRIDGTLKGLVSAPTYDLSLAVSHPDFTALVESLSDGVKFAERNLGEVRLRAKIAGNGEAARIEGLDAVLGPSQIAGVISARFDGPRPAFEADLSAGEFVADMFLAAAAQGGAAASSGTTAATSGSGEPGQRWSRDTIDLTGLNAFDLAAKISSQALAFQKYRFEDVTLRLNLADGVLDVEDLSGRLYGAPASVQARLTATSPAAVALTFSLKGADLRALMMDAAAVDAISGRLNLDGQFNSRGRSEFELVSGLKGEATFSATDGAIEGIDLGQLNSRLANINSELDLIALIGGSLNGGTTAIRSLQGRFTAEQGVLRSDNIRAVLEGGEGRATASIDLPNWQLALNSNFRLTGHPKAPPVGLLLMGPIDNPQREVRDQALRDFITAKLVAVGVRKLIPALTGNGAGGALGNVLEALTGGGAQPTPPASQTPTQNNAAQNSVPPATSGQSATPPPAEAPPPPTADKLFQNLLEGLIQGTGN